MSIITSIITSTTHVMVCNLHLRKCFKRHSCCCIKSHWCMHMDWIDSAASRCGCFLKTHRYTAMSALIPIAEFTGRTSGNICISKVPTMDSSRSISMEHWVMWTLNSLHPFFYQSCWLDNNATTSFNAPDSSTEPAQSDSLIRCDGNISNVTAMDNSTKCNWVIIALENPAV